MTAIQPLSPRINRVLAGALLAAVLLGLYGLHIRWEDDLVPRQRFYELLRFSTLALGAGWLWTQLSGWRMASALALAWLLAHLAMVGVLPALAAALLALAAIGLGSALARTLTLPLALQWLLGIAVITAGSGWLLPLPLHRQALYALACALIIYVRRVALRSALREAARDWRAAVAESPKLAATAVAVLGIASVASWIPTMMYDDVAYHLGLAAQLQTWGYYQMNAQTQIWALAPWASDLLHALVALIADREARGSVNLLWLLGAASLLYAVCRQCGLSARWSWIGVLLLASYPITSALLVSMHTELPATATLLGIVWLLQASEAAERARTLLLLGLLAGLLLQFKASMLLPLGLLVLWMAWRWRDALPWRALAPATAAGFMAGASSYVYAWALTGNPVLPLYNGWFQSPFFLAENLRDDRFGSGPGIDLLWQALVHTDRIYESWAMAGGWHVLVLAVAVPLALLHPRSRGLALIALIYLVGMYTLMHYLRYVYPALVLLIPAMLLGLSQLRPQPAALGLALALALANVVFIGNASWPLHEGSVRSLIDQRGSPRALYVKHVPERLLVELLGEQDRVLIVGRPMHAEFAGRAFTVAWYDPQLVKRIEPMTGQNSTQGVRELLTEYGFTHVLLAREAQIPRMVEHLQALGAELVRGESDVSLWKLPSDWPRERDLMRERDLAYQLRHRWR